MKILEPIHLAASNNELTPNLSLIQIKNGIATCTNSYMIARYNLSVTTITEDELKILEGKFIHKDVWKTIHKSDIITFNEDGIICFKKGIPSYFDYSECDRYPNAQGLIDIIREVGENKQSFASFNRKQLSIVLKIIDGEQIKICHSGNNQADIFYTREERGIAIYLMPCMDSFNRLII